MATSALLGSVTFTTTAGSKAVTATPTAGRFIVLVTAHTGYTATTFPTDNNSDGAGTYILAGRAQKATSADSLDIWVRRQPIGSGTSTTFTHNAAGSSGGGVAVIEITSPTKIGEVSVRQFGGASNQTATTTPTVTMPKGAVLTSSVVIGACFSATNSTTTVTHRGTPAYSELFDNGYATPTTGLEIMKIDSGETGSSIAWGGACASAYCAAVVEIDAAAVAGRALALSGVG